MELHTISPVYDAASNILILGSFPSVKSREAQFFYGHPQNRFWKVISAVLNEPLPASIPEKRALLLRNRIALWDVIAACDITGSSDASITNVIPNDITKILNTANIRCIFCNGAKAHTLYNTYLRPMTGHSAVKLPSTSPANASWSLDRLTEAWRAALRPYGF